MSKIKLYFLTGFLGSGKTTILRNLLENMEESKHIRDKNKKFEKEIRKLIA